MNKKVLTLCVVHQHPRVLLGMKKRGFGEGKWNGFGGKVKPGESIEAAARREMIEECGIEPVFMEKQGILDFHFENNAEYLEVHIFKVHEYEGEPKESEEMKPAWFDFMEIPFKNMWPDDLYWMPLFIKGRKFRGKFVFDKPSSSEYESKILDRVLEEVTDF